MSEKIGFDVKSSNALVEYSKALKACDEKEAELVRERKRLDQEIDRAAHKADERRSLADQFVRVLREIDYYRDRRRSLADEMSAAIDMADRRRREPDLPFEPPQELLPVPKDDDLFPAPEGYDQDPDQLTLPGGSWPPGVYRLRLNDGRMLAQVEVTTDMTDEQVVAEVSDTLTQEGFSGPFTLGKDGAVTSRFGALGSFTRLEQPEDIPAHADAPEPDVISKPKASKPRKARKSKEVA